MADDEGGMPSIFEPLGWGIGAMVLILVLAFFAEPIPAEETTAPVSSVEESQTNG